MTMEWTLMGFAALGMLASMTLALRHASRARLPQRLLASGTPRARAGKHTNTVQRD